MDYTIDATNKKLGRLASEVAVILQGKKSVDYNHALDKDDMVIIKNIYKLDVSTKKKREKIYYHHTTQIGHLRKETMEMVWDKRGPAEVLRRTVREMLPENKLRIKRLKRLIIEK